MSDKNLFKQGTTALQDQWNQLSKKDIAKAKGNVEKLSKTIAEKTGETASSVQEQLNSILTQVKASQPKKSAGAKARSFVGGVLKFAAAMAAIATAAAVGLAFWRKRMERTSEPSFPSAEPGTMDEAASAHAAEIRAEGADFLKTAESEAKDIPQSVESKAEELSGTVEAKASDFAETAETQAAEVGSGSSDETS
jgi:acyl-homoserine lactone acylase PvdQ